MLWCYCILRKTQCWYFPGQNGSDVANFVANVIVYIVIIEFIINVIDIVIVIVFGGGGGGGDAVVIFTAWNVMTQLPHVYNFTSTNPEN